MKLYLSIIGVAATAICAINIALGTAAWYEVLAAVAWCVALNFACDGLIAFLIHKIPDRHFGADKRLFRVSAREQRLYLRLGVKRWKDKIWELGGLGGFSKKRLAEPGNPAYVEQFIIECNKGVLTHRLSYPVGFLLMLTLWNACAFTIALPIACVNLYLNILPTIALRYNTPKLKSLLERLLRKEQRRSERKVL